MIGFALVNKAAQCGLDSFQRLHEERYTDFKNISIKLYYADLMQMQNRLILFANMTICLIAVFPAVGSCQSYNPIYGPDTVISRTVYCKDVTTHQPVPFCTLTISTKPYTNTNGHFHNTNRPSSYIAKTLGGVSQPPYQTTFSVQTDGLGQVLIWQKFTFVGQAEWIAACATVCDTADYATGYTTLKRSPNFFTQVAVLPTTVAMSITTG